VTHDRRFLDRVADEIVELENGRLSEYAGGYSAYRRQKAERVLSATRAFEKQQEFIEKEQEYIRRNIAGVNSRQAKGRRTKLGRVERLERPTEDGTSVGFRFDTARIGGRTFLRAKGLEAGYTAGEVIVRSVRFELLRGERLALLGENGSGKTTLLKTLAGRVSPLSGTVETGHDVSIGYYDQELSDLDPRRRVIDAVWDEHPEATEEEMRSYLARFAFRGDDVFASIAGLSGGEKGRLTLAVVMRQRHNLLLLDLDSREELEESLDDFPGSIVFVSHDRAFIDRLATRILDLREGRPMLFDGNYTDTAQSRAERRNKPEAPVREVLRPPSSVLSPTKRASRGKRASSAEERESARRRKRIAALEEKIAAREKEIEALENRLWEEALTLGPIEAHRLAQEKAGRKEELDTLVEEWGRLSEEEAPAGSSTAR
jgi:ATP-binding cassette subfamily F protein 3